MIATKKSGGAVRRRTWARPLLAGLLWSVAAARADDFGDISLSAQSMYSGNTFHGYAETQVMVENHSAAQTHQVTVIFPDRSYGGGDFINQLSRTVTLAPGAREIVPLLQPPVPAPGNGQIRVTVDGRHEGEIRAPNGTEHCDDYDRNGQPATVFISRTLDADVVEHLFKADHGAFTADKAVGAPDAGSGGYQPNCWMPDMRRGSRTNWLELDYATPQVVNRVTVFNPESSLSSSGSVELLGVSGTNLAKISLSTLANRYTGSNWLSEMVFPTISEPVKTVRLNLGRPSGYDMMVDAVQISGPTGTQWAAAARASSDNNASAGYYAPGANVDSVESLRAEMPVSDWSENWLAYTPFDALALGRGDLAAASSATANAIQNYVAAGGTLFIFGDSGLPDAWHAGPQKSFAGGVEYEVGFGNCYVFHSENPAELDAQAVRKLRETVRNNVQYWRALPYDSRAANTVLPIVADLKVPVRGIIFIMLLFVIVIGPVNLIYLSRRRRRTWMLWTIPVISLVTTLLVFAYSLLSEGITPDTRIAGVTVLDQASHHAATIGGTAFYCPLTPGGGLQFDFATEATPLIQVDGYRGGMAREVDWTQSQHFSHGWVTARVAAYFHLRKSEARRERIQVVKTNGKLEVVNSLGATIASLWVAGADRQIYTATRVAAGQQAGLIPASAAVSEKSGAGGLLRDLGFAAHPEALGEAGKYLRPNTYIAVLEGNPFIENALGPAAGAKRTKSSAVIFGILAPADLP